MNNQSTNLETFIDKLIEEKGLEYLDEETLEQIRKDLLGRLEDRINATILENMPPANLEEFEKKLDDEASNEEIQTYCAEKIPNLQEIIAAELLVFKQTYING